jgi:hypothetical protein
MNMLKTDLHILNSKMKEVDKEVLIKLWVKYLPRFKYFTEEDWKIFSYTKKRWFREIKPIYDRFKLYNVVSIWGKKILWHRLILMNYVEQPEGKPDCNHINWNKLDNRLENLEWCTKSHNTREAQRLWLKPTKKYYQFTEDWNLVKVWNSKKEAAIELWYSVLNANRYKPNWVMYTRAKWYRWNTENKFPEPVIYR